MARWLDSAWGKFRAWQRSTDCPEQLRLNPEQLRAAWTVWDLMRKSERAEGYQADDIHRQTVELAAAMGAELRQGAKVFACWLAQNREKLESQAAQRTIAEKAQVSDKVGAQLIR